MKLHEPEDARIKAAVAEFERMGSSLDLLDSYVSNIDVSIREEVRQQCRELAALQRFFARDNRIRNLIGQQIGDFEIVRELGSGAMGTVFQASQIGVDRDVALKLINPALLSRDDAIQRFHREAMNLSRLDHPNVVEIHTVGQHENWHYYTMAFVDGHSLETELARLADASADSKAQGWGLPHRDDEYFQNRAVRLVAEIASALAQAHAREISHRDVKPANIILSRDGRVKLADFGLARHEGDPTVTRVDQIVGTPTHLPPERFGGEEHDEKMTDCWALGVVLYELLTGALPFTGESANQVRTAVLAGNPKSIRDHRPSLDTDLDKVMRCALAHDPIDRYWNVVEFESDLRKYLANSPVKANQRGVAFAVRRNFRKHATLYVASLTLLIVILSVAIGSKVLRDRQAYQETVDSNAAVVRELMDASDWALLPPIDLMNGLRATEVLNEIETTDNIAALANRSSKKFRELRREMTAKGAGFLASELVPVSDQTDKEFDGQKVVEAAIVLHSAALIFNEPAILDILPAQPFLPRVSIALKGRDGVLLRGTISYRMIDGITGQLGEEISLGENPCTQVPVPVGYVRIKVETDSGAIHEFARYHKRGIHGYVIEHKVDPGALREGNWVRVNGDTLRLNDPDADMSGINKKEIRVDSFEIGKYEVSNAEYRRFLAAHPNHEKPLHWSEVEKYAPRYDNLPVVFVSWYDARAYAEWIGARLPTYAEWALAARGPEGRRAPWTDEFDFAYLGNTKQATVSPPEKLACVLVYLERARPVASFPEASTPTGIFHMLGNVEEWTESQAPEIRKNGGTFAARPYSRLSIGYHWGAEIDKKALHTISTNGPEWSWAQHSLGFRCARSIAIR